MLQRPVQGAWRQNAGPPRTKDWFTASPARHRCVWQARRFLAAVLIVVVWAVTGPIFGFSDTWQLVINTGTTIVTFLMVFLFSTRQNRDSLAVQVKLADLIIAVGGAHNELANAEELSEEGLRAPRTAPQARLARRRRAERAGMIARSRRLQAGKGRRRRARPRTFFASSAKAFFNRP